MSIRSLFTLLSFGAILGAQSTAPAPDVRARIDSNYGKIPLQFEANQGQQPEQVKFLSRGKDYTLFLTPDGATLSLRKVKAKTRAVEAATDLRLKLEGGNRDVKLSGADPLPGRMNYFIGNDRGKWRTNVATYGKVRYAQAYPGIDLVFYGNQRLLEYDFVLSPGARPEKIRLAVEGADRTSVDDSSGDLIIGAAGQEIRFHKPVVYQPETESAGRREVDGRFLVSQNHVGFAVADYDHARPLVIDPVLAYSTYLGGSNVDYANAITVDKSGNAYITGLTCSTNFPTTAGSYDTTLTSAQNTYCEAGLNYSASDVFITKLNSEGTGLIWSTFLGGSWGDYGTSIALDSSDNVVVGGYTGSSDFPTTAALQTVCAPVATYNSNCSVQTIVSTCYGGPIEGSNSNWSGFVTKLASNGESLIFSTFIGGSGYDGVTAVGLNSSGEIYVAGADAGSQQYGTLCDPSPQTSFTWPVTSNGYSGWPTPNGMPSGDQTHLAFSVLSADGSSLVYSTLFGSTNGNKNGTETNPIAMAIDSSGKAYIGGYTNHSDYPTTGGALQTTCPACTNNPDGFVVAFDPSQSGGASLVYSTYLGGDGVGYTQNGCASAPGDMITGIAVDSKSNAYVTGSACSTNFPTTAHAYQHTDPLAGSCSTGTPNAFLSKLNSTGSELVYSTYLGGTQCEGNTEGHSVVVVSGDDAFVTGNTNDPTFPTLDPLQSFLGGPDVFVTEFNDKGSALLFSTLYSSNGTYGNGIYADNYGNVYFTGQASQYLPTTAGAFQTTYGGDLDAFAARISFNQADLAVMDSAPATVLRDTNLTYTIAVTNNGPDTASEVTLTATVPGGTKFVSATPTTGHCGKPDAGVVTCTVPSLANAAGFGVSLVVDVKEKSGTLSETATVSSLVWDSNPGNNSATATTTVN